MLWKYSTVQKLHYLILTEKHSTPHLDTKDYKYTLKPENLSKSLKIRDSCRNVTMLKTL